MWRKLERWGSLKEEAKEVGGKLRETMVLEKTTIGKVEERKEEKEVGKEKEKV